MHEDTYIPCQAEIIISLHVEEDASFLCFLNNVASFH